MDAEKQTIGEINHEDPKPVIFPQNISNKKPVTSSYKELNLSKIKILYN
jgi:hypothetical protein